MSQTDFFSNSNLTSELTDQNEGSVEYLVSALAGHEFGVRLATLQEVLRYNPAAVAPLPNAPAWLEGVLSLRGAITSIVDLRTFFKLPRPAESSAGGLELFGIGAAVPRLLILHSEETVVGVIVDDIRGVLFIKPDELKPVPESVGLPRFYLEGIYSDPNTNKITALLDTAKLINSAEMLVFEPATF